ncbi:gamma-glutamyltransferase, partial [Staphylococcus aureus]|nr:gamma-glutamyltransferase [Staphylococcus aureus]
GGEVLSISIQTFLSPEIFDYETHRVYFIDVQFPLLAEQVRWMHDKYCVYESVVRIMFSEVSAHIEDLRSSENAGENYI